MATPTDDPIENAEELRGASRLAASVARLEHCLLIVRHGRTAWNDEDRMSTRTDVPLSNAGLAQARQLAAALRECRLDYAWTSPLQRAATTARTVLEPHGAIELRNDERLVEPDGGPFEGISFGELETGAHASAFAAYQDEERPVFPAGAPPMSESAATARAFVADVASMPGRHFAASHGALIRILACAFLGMKPSYHRRLRLYKCHAAVWKFYPEPPHQLSGWNLPSD